eukprot:CAMPEP_0115864530 /NCGR_PEP_ID=MMETSP0287-20121206/19249_1 /TAXON_ID=412157 /ORGANISM="Chrysochromulina rotalis, Strain UIO044" /LENGTH=33 /DNA_ID= /DNA_START= /DNA_END= /DNA_ORIENTATION=
MTRMDWNRVFDCVTRLNTVQPVAVVQLASTARK